MTKDLGKLWAERMTKSERDTSFPDSEPRDAATLMLIDRSGAAPKVLLGRRHAGHKFMPGKFVFPGGRIEPLDRQMTAVSELHPDAQTKLLERVDKPGPRFRAGVCARRGTRNRGRDRSAARRASATSRPPYAGRNLDRIRQGQGASRTSGRSTSSHAPSRRPAGRAVSIRVSSPPTPPQSRTQSRASSGRTSNWSSSLGCRSRKPPISTCRPSPASCWRNCWRAWKPAWGTTCRCRSISWSNGKFFRELL